MSMSRLLITFFFACMAPFALAQTPVKAPAQPAPVAGVDYRLIETPLPYQPLKGQIEVAEVFHYSCVHCAHFQPKVDAWKKSLPAGVRFAYVPLPHSADDALTRAFFAAQTTGALTKTHNAMFRALHVDETLPRNASIGEVAEFYRTQGLDKSRMQAAMEDPARITQMMAARKFAINAGISGTPSLIINGKYLVLGNSHDELLRNASRIVTMLRALPANKR